MPGVKVLKSIISEYGLKWLANRFIYSVKIKSLSAFPATEGWYERKTPYPKRLGLFRIDAETLGTYLREKLTNEEKQRLISLADKICDGIITGFSSIELNYTNPIDWQLNPLNGERCDVKLKWYRIADFDKKRGDIKVIWEASRFSHFITLARAFLLTGNDKYYKAFSGQLSDWLEKNPYSYGANYKCGQECSLRMTNALLAYAVFKKSGVTTDADESNLKDLVDRCYRKILSNFFYAHRCIKNNHTISELMGMIAGAWCCGSEEQLDRAYKWLDEVVEEQFTKDGGYRQFSFNYQRLAMQDIECIISMSLATGRYLGANSLNRIKNSALLMYQCQDEAGDMPNYGPNDGALVFPVTSCEYRDFRPVINASYALTTGKQIYADDIHREELIWFSCGKELDKYPSESIARESMKYPEAGLFTIRNDNSWAMLVANNYKSRPAHMDQLHFDLWMDNVNIFCDAGTYSYADGEGRKLVKNESHNTAVIDGIEQMNAQGPFMILDWTKRKVAKAGKDFFEGIIESQNGYIHERKIRTTADGYQINDRVSEDAYIHFHTACDVEIRDRNAILSSKGKELCMIIADSITVNESFRSLYYLRREKTTDIFIKANAGQETISKIVMMTKETR